ncbi:MAG: DUF2232 domain-containing protein, partial [Eubacteriales bacterium]|nr:DUF2232 domain-containing protein [Eubacteriales bacterium]
MDVKTLKITQGALMTAIFGVLVFLNRQTAGMVQEILVYVYPLPMAVYSAKYGFKTALPAAAAMVLLSFFLGTPNYAFYASTSMLIGLTLGVCLFKKVSTEKIMFAVIFMAIVINLVDILVVSSVSGITITKSAMEMQKMMNETFESSMMQNVLAQYPDEQRTLLLESIKNVYTVDTLVKLFIVGNVLFGFFQGFIIYQLSLLIMKRLRIKVPAPRSFYDFKPPVWTGYVALGLFFIYMFVGSRFLTTEWKDAFLAIGMTGFMYLGFFGIIGISLFLKQRMRNRVFPVIIAVLVTLMASYVSMIVGYCYITGAFRGLFALPG